MRPHVELIHEDDYVWHPAELPYTVGEVRERRLSSDEEDGSAALSLAFDSAASVTGGHFDAGAGLSLDVPAITQSGAYEAVLRLTLS
ncbi:hypothetical protein [Streptomyces sp. NPDC060027]|uniref:hypothetical protein n=1 Tax=Streptomyces sp. NPDC060027 TaxID=3347040 RepID=UPI003681DF03